MLFHFIFCFVYSLPFWLFADWNLFIKHRWVKFQICTPYWTIQLSPFASSKLHYDFHVFERDIIQFCSSQYRGLQNKINCWCFKLWSTFLESGQVHVTEFTVNISDYVMCHALKKKITLVFVFRWKLPCHNLLKAYTSNPWT